MRDAGDVAVLEWRRLAGLDEGLLEESRLGYGMTESMPGEDSRVGEFVLEQLWDVLRRVTVRLDEAARADDAKVSGPADKLLRGPVAEMLLTVKDVGFALSSGFLRHEVPEGHSPCGGRREGEVLGWWAEAAPSLGLLLLGKVAQARVVLDEVMRAVGEKPQTYPGVDGALLAKAKAGVGKLEAQVRVVNTGLRDLFAGNG